MTTYPRVVTWARLLALFSFIALAILLNYRYDRVLALFQTRTAGQALVALSSAVNTQSLDVETGVRGYVLTGDDAYLEPYRTGLQSIAALEQRVREMAVVDAGQRAQLDEVMSALNRELDVARRTIEARRSGGLDAARARIGEGKAAMDRLRAATRALSQGASARVDRERADNQVGLRATRYLMVFLFLFAIAMLAFAAWQLRREFRRRGRVEAELRDAYATVETRVEERTRDLTAAHAEAQAANRLKDDFLATVSHELRTPLHAIVGWVHLLKKGIAQDRERAVDAIERNALVQTRLIDDLLDVSRMTQGRLSMAVFPLDFRKAIEAALLTVRPAADAKDIALVVVADGEFRVFGDEARLQQVAWNLLSNAVKFTPKGGRVSVEIVTTGLDVHLRVTDTGEGIDPAFLPHMFEPFRQGAERPTRAGLGLGLAIVRHIVQLHGGTVTAASEGLGRGTTMTVTLPVSLSLRDLPERLTRDDGRASLGLRVLVAEDDQDSAVILETLLRYRGCEVRTGRTAQQFLDILGEWEPDLLLCDVGLPDDDGYSLLQKTRARGGESIPAIALTAFAREEDKARAKTAGFAAHVSKPVDPEYLLGEISRALSAPASRYES